MLKIENLHAEIDGKEILKGLTLEVGAGEVHAIMGPNGSLMFWAEGPVMK